MGTVLLSGGLIGATLGLYIFNYLKAVGQVDLLVKLCYVIFLGIIGCLMFIESLNAIRRARSKTYVINRGNRHKGLVHTLPIKKSNGVIKKPPPTPNIPERIPTNPPRPRSRKALTETSAMGK
jgi:hypothetical protein